MNFKSLGDENLVSATLDFVQQEGEILTQVLYCFKEIEARRLYSDYGYSSLYDMAREYFGYSDDQAYRRVKAMRLLKSLPQIDQKIASGELSLSSLTYAQDLFQKEEKLKNEFSTDKKLEILNEISNKSVREAQRITQEYSSEPKAKKADYIKDIGDSKIELFCTASEELKAHLEDLKKIYPDLSIGEILQVVCEQSLKPATSKKRLVINSKAQIKRDVFQNAQNKCEICGSNYHLEIDHIIPKAKGGSSHPANLRLLCKSCNQRSAIKEFGVGKMARYLT